MDNCVSEKTFGEYDKEEIWKMLVDLKDQNQEFEKMIYRKNTEIVNLKDEKDILIRTIKIIMKEGN